MRAVVIILGWCAVSCAVDHPVGSPRDSAVDQATEAGLSDTRWDVLDDASLPPSDVPTDIHFPDVTTWDGGVDCEGYPRCEGNALITCVAGAIDAIPCELRCQDDVIEGAQCYDLRPINLGPGAFADSDCAGTVLEDAEWDTTDCTGIMDGCGAHFTTVRDDFEVCIVNFSNFELTGTLRLRGKRGLVIVSAGDLTVTGTIDAGAHSASPGPGGGQACSAELEATGPHAGQSGGTEMAGNSGGGGGGSASLGGRGGQGGTVTGVAGTFHDPAYRLSPFLQSSGGGCGGGTMRAEGGAGGGVIHLVARHNLEIHGEIFLGGGGGNGGLEDEESDGLGAGGGGGSGGNLLLEAGERVFFGDDARVWLSGGGGGGGAACLSDRMTGSGANGESGRSRLQPAGGAAGQADGCTMSLGQRGGDGGGASPNRRVMSGEEGNGTSQLGGNGGGGGGGLGMMVVRSPVTPTVLPGGSAAYFDLPATFDPVIP